MKWNSELYDTKHSFVAEYGKALIEAVNIEKGQKILDLGCGTGILTRELARNGANVIGIDSSSDMVAKAKLNYPDLQFQTAEATELPFANYFDTVFSNAVFHWITYQKKLLTSIYASLKTNGRLVCEFGAKNNIHQIESAFKKVLEQKGLSYSSMFFLPSKEEYKLLLEEAGFEVKHILEYDRPTPLKDGKQGLINWINQFFAAYLSKVQVDQRNQILLETEKLCEASLWETDHWIADYRRIQVIAAKNR